jgi:hypothetical protein
MRIAAALILFFSAAYFLPLHSQSGNPGTLKELGADVESVKGRSFTLILKLKYIDTVFEKLTFYDSENIDITFDISDRSLRKRLAPEMKNLKEGMNYRVTFTVKDKNNYGGVDGDLISMKPVILELIPFAPENKKAE